MKSFAEIDVENGGNYLRLLSVSAKLSKLFSESQTPYIYYRAAENIFCKSFSAENLSRGDSAFDANFNSIGIGLKTFISENKFSTEKIAEFNKLSTSLRNLSTEELAIKLSTYRNERIDLAKRLYNTNESLYHIVARRSNELILFETDYDIINLEQIRNVKATNSGINFDDGINFYSFNHSKSTLFRKFEIPDNAYRLPVDIIDDPYSLLLEIFEENRSILADKNLLERGKNFVILPLYGMQNKKKFVFQASGLNQWNAKPRANQERRGLGEVYIPIPKAIHNLYPNFFPARDHEFNLRIPTGEILRAKICQDGSKALMTNPNKAIAEWLLRTVLGLQEGELATIEKLEILGFDSVVIYKDNNTNYRIDKAKSDSFEKFITNP